MGRNQGGLRLLRAVAAASVLVLALSGSAFVTRASVSNTGAPAEWKTPSFSSPSVSADGRYVAFDSFAGNLASGASDGGVFVRDTRGGTTTAVSVRANGTVDDAADTPAISGDGRFVAFVSDDPQLVPGGNGNFYQVFLRDRTAGVTTRVSSKPNGNQGTDDSGMPSLSSDGRYIAFESDSPGLVLGDTNGWTDVFVRDRATNTMRRVSLFPNGAEADFGGGSPSISGNGRMVAFVSMERLVPADTNTWPDVYVRDLTANTTTLASVATNGAIPSGPNEVPRISADGRFVAFTSAATNLDGLVDDNAGTDVFVRDLVGGTTQRVSLSSSGGLAHGNAIRPSISTDGRLVSYESTAFDAVAGDTNAVADAFVYDRTLGQASRVSTDDAGGQLLPGGTQPALSSDGRIVAFGSDAAIPGQSAATVGQLYVRLTAPADTADTPPMVSIGNASVVEGDLRSRQLRFTVTLSRPAPVPVSVQYATASGTATAGTDFVAKSGTLTLAAGVTAGVVAVDVKGDRLVEPQEKFTVKLTNPQGVLRSRATGTGAIVSDDEPTNPAVRISVGSASVVEGDFGTRALRFPVTLSASSALPVTVKFTTNAGTAGAADFTAKAGTAVIPARATSTVINISVRPDFVLEATETFTVRLSGPIGATLNRATGTGSVLDDG